MAAKKKAKKVAKAPKPRKETREAPGIGHNIASLRSAGAAYVERFLNLSDTMASDMAGYRSDFKELYQEAAGDLGLKKSVITKELKRILANKKAAEKEAEMAADEREQAQMWRGAMVGTQWELFATGDLSPASEAEGSAGESDEAGVKD